ncbi:hypothetical protein C9374_011438 [Naegleria lovaniensis]|uniref:THIF-type NAD/FAD binding fold domain-containing protein n=1 Tax=Naegleria lovaniensis TaxID=51637 RepID=A0AA88H0W7_NAELO|nr:uncharacterized protein C9374_011438 [Naegleria lovaniensis]KAG2392713.1 hypothetical protein C9374_011438 [Naegleria lovaniensis]
MHTQEQVPSFYKIVSLPSSTSSSFQNYTTSEAFCRNIGLVSIEEQRKIESTRVAVAGCGGAGAGYASTLARCGIGSFHLADHDTYELVNFNRQQTATIHTVGRNKAIATGEVVLSINPHAHVKAFDQGIDEKSIDDFLEGVHVVMDAIDLFAPRTRRLLYQHAYKKGIPVFTAGPIGWSCAWEIFLPTGPSFDEFCGFTDDMNDEELIIRHIVSTAPGGTHLKYMKPKSIDFSNHAAPSLGSTCTMLHGMLSNEVLIYITKRREVKGVPYYFQFDSLTLQFKQGYLRWGNANPIQRIKIWYVKRLLEKGKKEREAEKKALELQQTK